MATIRTYPDLSARCLAERHDLSLRLWYILRRHSPGGCGKLTMAEVHELSCGNRRQTRRWIRAGLGTFWHRCGDHLYLHSLAKVSAVLGVKPRKKPVAITSEELEDLQTFRATLYASWLAGKPKTISQKLLAEIFGRSDRTLRTWTQTAGVHVRRNLVWSRLPDEEALKHYPVGVMATLGMKVPEEEAARPDKAKFWLECWTDYPYKEDWKYTKGNKPALVRPFVNTYFSFLPRGPKTTLQKRACRAIKGKKRTSHDLDNNPARSPAKARFLIPRFEASEDKQVFMAQLDRRRSARDKSLQKNGFAIYENPSWHHEAKCWEMQTIA